MRVGGIASLVPASPTAAVNVFYKSNIKINGTCHEYFNYLFLFKKKQMA